MRYLGDDDTGENLQRDELDRLHAAGLKVALVFQTGKSFVLNRSGAECATVALQQANALGCPADRPVYFAIDQNPNVFTDAQWLVTIRFFLDAAEVLGPARVGVYGGRRALDLIEGGFAAWGWQTYAWSGYIADRGDSRLQDIWHPRANVRQYLNGQSLCGGLVDFDQSMTEDFGQW